jgi:succinate-semialdehyde dehydrogenase
MQISIEDLVSKSRDAQKKFESYTQKEVDEIVRAIGKAVYDNAELLARMAVDETRMGVYEHKVSKNKGKAKMIWNHLKDKKSMGVIRELPEVGIVEMARPMGVVAAVTPCTNPAPTVMGNAMMALKCKNSIIIAPHPRAKKCCQKAVELINAELEKLQAPKDLIQIIEEPTIELTGLLMKSCDVIVATGGAGMVKSAYSSGKPAYGVGAGNVQCIVDEGYDFNVAVPKIIAGRSFDNGIICSGEQTVILPAGAYKEIIAAFEANGAYYSEDPETVGRIRSVLFKDGVMNKDLVGQSVQTVARAAGVLMPDNTKVIIVKASGFGADDLLSKEKMCPVLSAYTYEGFEDALKIALENLNVEGRGHSVSIHSNNKENLITAGKTIPVCRILVNQICATMNGGAITNGLEPTTTLGCGTWGNNSFCENFSYKHLYNTVRLASEIPNAYVPSDDEIWRTEN